jgi:hypothetical protein
MMMMMIIIIIIIIAGTGILLKPLPTNLQKLDLPRHTDTKFFYTQKYVKYFDVS